MSGVGEVNELMIRTVEGQLEGSYAGSEEPHGAEEDQAFYNLGKVSPFADLLISGLLYLPCVLHFSCRSVESCLSFMQSALFFRSHVSDLPLPFSSMSNSGISYYRGHPGFLATISFHFIALLRNGRGYLA